MNLKGLFYWLKRLFPPCAVGEIKQGELVYFTDNSRRCVSAVQSDIDAPMGIAVASAKPHEKVKVVQRGWFNVDASDLPDDIYLK